MATSDEFALNALDYLYLGGGKESLDQLRVHKPVHVSDLDSGKAQVYATLALVEAVRELTAKLDDHKELLKTQLGQLNTNVNRIAEKL